MIFGFLLAICFNPYIWTAATQPRWSFLAIALPIMIWRYSPRFGSPNHFTLTHAIGLTFLAWATLSLLWTPNLPDAFNELIQLVIVAEAFVLGARLNTLKPIFMGLAAGLAISSLLILSPLQGLIAHQPISTHLEGLLGNHNMLAEAAILTLIGCIGYRLWWFIPGLLPAMFMPPMARGALVAGLTAFGIWLWSRSRILAGLLMLLSIFAVVILIDQRSSSVIERWSIWTETFQSLSFKGYGLGSFYFLYPFITSTFDTTLARPEHPHNELMEIWFELGFIGAFLYTVMVATAFRSADGLARCILVAFVTIGLFAFPSHVPFTAFIGALMLGHAARLGSSIWAEYEPGGLRLRSWYGRKPAHQEPSGQLPYRG